eukprot:scaffold482043_cov15-Prasinocladus_malaysianus.AAC.1
MELYLNFKAFAVKERIWTGPFATMCGNAFCSPAGVNLFRRPRPPCHSSIAHQREAKLEDFAPVRQTSSENIQ